MTLMVNFATALPALLVTFTLYSPLFSAAMFLTVSVVNVSLSLTATTCDVAIGWSLNSQVALAVGTAMKSTGITRLWPARTDCGDLKRES